MGQADELKRIKEKELIAAESSPKEIRDALAELDSKFEEIRKNPSLSQTWYGDDNTYKRWASYLWYSPLDYLVKLSVPVYIAHGARDTSSPVESDDAVRDRFRTLGKSNLTYRRYDDLDHQWNEASGQNDGPRVVGDLIDWLKSMGLSR